MLCAVRFSGTGKPRLKKSNCIWREKQMNRNKKIRCPVAVPCYCSSGGRRHGSHVRSLEALRGLHSDALHPDAERRRGQYLFLR